MHEGIWFTKNITDNMTALRGYTFFRIVLKSGNACAMIGHKRADQHTPQLLMKLFDTLPT